VSAKKVEEELSKRIEPLPDYSIIYLHIDPNQYFPVLQQMMDFFVNEKDMGGIYITTTRPARAISNRLSLKKIDLEDIFFVDCISYSVGANIRDEDEILYVESPTQLESVMLKTYWLLKKVETEQKFVFLDSLNTLGIYNAERMLSEFFHTFINKLRTQEVFGVILTVGEDPPKEVIKMLELVCDEAMDLRKSKNSKEGA
jgi:archaellum biogenesis ATPase FlaH